MIHRSAAAAGVLTLTTLLVVGCGAAEGRTPTAPSTPSTVAVNSTPSLQAGLMHLLPAGGRLVPVDGKPYLEADLGGEGRLDVIGVYVVGRPPAQAAGALVAQVAPSGTLRVLWHLAAGSRGAYGVDRVALVDFTGSGRPQVLIALNTGATSSTVTVLGFNGASPETLLRRDGGRVAVASQADGGGLPGIALWTHDTGAAGTTAVWRWNAALGTFARADTAFPSYYAATVVPFDQTHLVHAAWSYFYLAEDQVKAGDYSGALATARTGFDGFGTTYMSGDPAFYVVEADAYRGLDECEAAVPLYRKALLATKNGSAGDALAAEAGFGLGVCLRAEGESANALSAFRQALAAGPQDGNWNGYAQARVQVGA